MSFLRQQKFDYLEAVIFTDKIGQTIDFVSNKIDRSIRKINMGQTPPAPIVLIGDQSCIRIGRKIKKIKDFIKRDAESSTFTIRSVYLEVKKNVEPDIIPIIDPFDGVIDIKKKIVRTILSPEETIRLHPEAIFEAILLVCEHGFKASGDFFEDARKSINNIDALSTSEIRNAFTEILLSPHPAKGMKLLGKSGVLDIILPELVETYRLKQNSRYHMYDVFSHSIYTCDAIEEQDLVLRLAALFHDIGKPQTRGIKEPTFYNHEVVGAKITKKILKRLGYKNKVIDRVTRLIRNHMYCYTREWTDEAIVRFIDRVGIIEDDMSNLENIPLFKLRAADRIGNGLKSGLPITQKQKDFEKRIRTVMTAKKIKDA